MLTDGESNVDFQLTVPMAEYCKDNGILIFVICEFIHHHSALGHDADLTWPHDNEPTSIERGVLNLSWVWRPEFEYNHASLCVS